MAHFDLMDVVTYNESLYVVEETTEDGVYLAPLDSRYDNYSNVEIFLSVDEFNQLTKEV